MVTSQPRMLLPARNLGYACSAARNVSDQASVASTGPTSARQTRITRAPCSATISSNGRAAGVIRGQRGPYPNCEVPGDSRCGKRQKGRKARLMKVVAASLVLLFACKAKGAPDP